MLTSLAFKWPTAPNEGVHELRIVHLREDTPRQQDCSHTSGALQCEPPHVLRIAFRARARRLAMFHLYFDGLRAASPPPETLGIEKHNQTVSSLRTPGYAFCLSRDNHDATSRSALPRTPNIRTRAGHAVQKLASPVRDVQRWSPVLCNSGCTAQLISCAVPGPASGRPGLLQHLTTTSPTMTGQKMHACWAQILLPLTCRLTVAFKSGGDTRFDGTLQTPHSNQYLRVAG